MKFSNISQSLFIALCLLSSTSFANELQNEAKHTKDLHVFFNCTLTNYYSKLYESIEIGKDVKLSELSKHCKVVIENSLEWPEYVKNIEMHAELDIEELQVDNSFDAKTSIVYACSLSDEQICKPYMLSLEEDKILQFNHESYDRQRNAFDKRLKYVNSLLKNNKNAVIYRRMLLSSNFQRRFLYDRGLFDHFLNIESLENIQNNSIKLGIVRKTAAVQQNRQSETDNDDMNRYQQIQQMLYEKEIRPLEFFFKQKYSIDHWFDEIIMSPQLAIYSPRLTTTSAGYLLMSADLGKGIYIVFEDKTCIYIDSFNKLHIFRGWLSGGRPVLVYDARDNYFWSILPFKENTRDRYVELLKELKTRDENHALSQYIDIDQTGFPATEMFKTTFLEEKNHSSTISQEAFRMLIARERGSDERIEQSKEFALSGLYNSFVDAMLHNMFIESCSDVECSGEIGRRMFMNEVGGSIENLRYNNYSTYINFYLGSPFEVWLSGELTCTVGTQIALTFEMYEKMLEDSSYYCKQDIQKTLEGLSFHFWCWDEDGEYVFENMLKRIPFRKAQTRTEVHKNSSKVPTVCLHNSVESIDVIDCPDVEYNLLYQSRTTTKPNKTYEYLRSSN